MAIQYLDAKRIRGSSTASSTASFESDFTSTTGWTQNSTNISISTGNNRVDYDTTSSGSSTSTLVYDLGTSNISETAWVLRGKSVITNYTVGGDGSSCHLFVGLSDEDHTSVFDNNQDSISFAIGAGTNDDNYYIGSSNGQAMYTLTNHGHSNIMAHVPTEETVYFELKRTSTTGVTLNLFTDAGFSTPVSNGSYSVVLGSVPTGFRYLVFKSRDRSVSGSDCQGYIQDLQFYNGVTVATTDEKATLAPATDSLGSNGDATNNADLDTTNEKLGTGCLDFNGSSDYIDAGSLQTNSAMTTKGTIAFWINFDAISNGEKVFMISDSNGTDGQIYMEIESSGDAGKIMCGCDLGGTPQWAIRMVADLLDASTWYHVALTHDGTSPKVYLNGVDQTTTQVSTDLTKWVSMTSGMDSFEFGRSNYGGSTGAYFNGKFDDIGIWNDALIIGTDEDTADSIKWLHNDGDGKLASTIPSGLRAYYNCDSATVTNTAPTASSDLPENTLFEETDVKTFTNSQSNAGIETYWLQDSEWKKGYDTLLLDHSSSTGNENSFDDRTALGEKILSGNSLIGKKVKSIKVKLRVGAGSPAGDIVMNVVNNVSGSSYGTVKHTFGTALGGNAVLTSSYVEYEFVATSPYTVVANDCFNVQLTSGTETDNHGSPSPYFLLDCKDTSQSNADLVLFRDSGGWTTEIGKSCYMKFYGSAT